MKDKITKEGIHMTMISVPVPVLLGSLLVLNVISMLVFGVDKLKSKKRGGRIPESKLLLVALLAPFGAYASMLLFRHKTRKVKFLLVPIFLFIQLWLLSCYMFK